MEKVDNRTLHALDELELKYDIYNNYTHNIEYAVIDLGEMKIALCEHGFIYNSEICSNYFTKPQIINALRVYIIANELNLNNASIRISDIRNIYGIKTYFADTVLDKIYVKDFICAKEEEHAGYEGSFIFSETEYQEKYSKLKKHRNKIYSKVTYLTDKQKQVIMYK